MEQREFRLHKDILWSIIQSQAGSLQKAILELVMNSVDANATSVDITLTERMLKVVDDGKGFSDRSEIEAFFETFGTPHTEGDATFGRFRMGRGQLMSFTRNVWRSGPFRMEVDIRDQGLNYVLKSDEPMIAGCTIEGELYEPFKPSELLITLRALEDLCKYTPIPVNLNGKRISVDMAKEKWTFVDDDAYYLLKADARQLAVYNLGVEVCKYGAYNYGTGGVVVSRKQLEVNFARNDILLSKCEVWKRVAAKVRAHSRQSEEKKPQKNENYRALLATQMLSADLSAEEFQNAFMSEKLITDFSGKHYSLSDVCSAVTHRYNGTLALAPNLTNLKADKVHDSKLGFIVSPKTMERFGLDSLEEVFEQLEAAGTSLGLVPPGRYSSVGNTLRDLKKALKSFDAVSKLITEAHHPVAMSSLTPEEKEVLDVLNEAQNCLIRGFHRHSTGRTIRNLRVGESETADAWTDGESYICINREQLKVPGFPGSALTRFLALGTLLVHEYTHTDDDTAGHVHDSDFFQTYEAVTCATNTLGEFVDAALNKWLAIRKKNAAKHLRSGELKELDRQAALGVAA